MILQEKDTEEAAEQSYAEPKVHLEQSMAPQDETAGAHASGYEQSEAEPPRGVKVEDDTEGQQGAHHGSGSCRVGADVYPVVDDYAHHLQYGGSGQDAYHEVGHIHLYHHVEACGVADDENQVGYGACLAVAHFRLRPFLHALPHIDCNQRYGYGETIDDGQDEQLVVQRQHAHETEHKQYEKCQCREIERCEQHGEKLGGVNEIFAWHVLENGGVQ